MHSKISSLDASKFSGMIHSLEGKNKSLIGDNDRMYLQRIFSSGIQKYIKRLNALGFSGQGQVLDAGCGYGQWSLALSELNTFVESCDISSTRIGFLKQLMELASIPNLSAQVSGLSPLPYSSDYFDSIFCYGVLFLTPWRQSLFELSRVLKPNGKLYLTANGLGWYTFLWETEHNKADDYDPKSVAARCLCDTLEYDRYQIFEPGSNILIEPDSITLELKKLGFSSVDIAPEGTLHLDNSFPPPIPFFNGRYAGQLAAYELIATK